MSPLNCTAVKLGLVLLSKLWPSIESVPLAEDSVKKGSDGWVAEESPKCFAVLPFPLCDDGECGRLTNGQAGNKSLVMQVTH